MDFCFAILSSAKGGSGEFDDSEAALVSMSGDLLFQCILPFVLLMVFHGVSEGGAWIWERCARVTWESKPDTKPPLLCPMHTVLSVYQALPGIFCNRLRDAYPSAKRIRTTRNGKSKNKAIITPTCELSLPPPTTQFLILPSFLTNQNKKIRLKPPPKTIKAATENPPIRDPSTHIPPTHHIPKFPIVWEKPTDRPEGPGSGGRNLGFGFGIWIFVLQP